MLQGDKSGCFEKQPKRETKHFESAFKFRGIWREEAKYRAWMATQKISGTGTKLIHFAEGK